MKKEENRFFPFLSTRARFARRLAKFVKKKKKDSNKHTKNELWTSTTFSTLALNCQTLRGKNHATPACNDLVPCICTVIALKTHTVKRQFCLVFSYTYLCCIRSLKTVFWKQIAQQRLILGVFDYEPVSQTIPRIFNTRPLYSLLTLIPLVSWVCHISFSWLRQVVNVCSIKGKNKGKGKNSKSV